MNINNEKFDDVFRLIEPLSGQIKNILLVHSMSARYGVQYCLENCIDIKDHLLADVFK